MNWYFRVWQKYGEFSGRARRKEYWMFVLFNMLISMVLGFIDGLLLASSGIMFLTYLYMFAILIPGLAVAVRRLHDTGKSGWYILLSFIPIVGTIILLVILATEGDTGLNQYGPDPKRVYTDPDPTPVSNITNARERSSSKNTGYGNDPVTRPLETMKAPIPIVETPISSYDTQKYVQPEQEYFPVSIYQHTGSFAGKTHSIKGTWKNDCIEALIGRRSPDSYPDVNINEPVISRKHMRLLMKNGSYSLKLNSATNPTSINGNLIDPFMSHQIVIGDIIEIGDIQLELIS